MTENSIQIYDEYKMTGETGDMIFQVSDVNPWQKILERERLHADRSL